MFLEAIVLGLLVGWLRGGRTLCLGHYEFKGWVLVVLGFLLQMLPMLLGRMSWMQQNGHIVAFMTMLLVFLVVVLNIDRKGFWFVALGAMLNCVAMMFHGLKMPVVLSVLQNYGRTEMVESIRSGAVLNYVGLEAYGHWSDYLGKVIAMPKMYPIAHALSFGDILMSIGLVVFIAHQMNTSYYGGHKSPMVQITYPTRF